MSYAARAQSLIANTTYEVRKNEKDEITLLVLPEGATKQTKKLEPITWTTDPRPDLVDDSALWTRLLTDAYALDGNDPASVFGVLHGFRCVGAGLVVERGRVRLEPGEIGDEYPALRTTYLAPHTAAIKDLFAGLAHPEAA